MEVQTFPVALLRKKKKKVEVSATLQLMVVLSLFQCVARSVISLKILKSICATKHVVYIYGLEGVILAF